jgi:hypothetical protein
VTWQTRTSSSTSTRFGAKRNACTRKAGDGSGLSDAERDRLQAINVELDRCYDLLHQRQGRRDADRDPSGATLRSARTVEGYEQ